MNYVPLEFQWFYQNLNHIYQRKLEKAMLRDHTYMCTIYRYFTCWYKTAICRRQKYHVPCLIYCSFDVKLFCSFLIQCICNVNISLLPAAIFYISLTLESAAAVRYSSNTNTDTYIYPIRVGSRYFSILKNMCTVQFTA